jgi:GTPase
MKMVKMMMMGQERSGKSTVIGVMLSGENDDGEGSARIHVLSHKHELLSGQTSSMSQHLLGFDSHGHSVPNHTPLSYSYSHSSQHIVDKAHSLV